MDSTGYEQMKDHSNPPKNECKDWPFRALGSTLLGVLLTIAAVVASKQSTSIRQVAVPTLSEKEVVVHLPKAFVRGVLTEEHGVRFASIPYGKAERFKNPELVDLVGEFDARTLPSFCRLVYLCCRGPPWDQGVPGGLEGCLSLDLHAPLQVMQNTYLKVPVLFFIHGGSCQFAWKLPPTSDWSAFDPQTLVMKLNMVVVKVSFRYAVFGFLGSKRMQANPNQSIGNFGILDQQVAMRWVNKNIQYFGGDHDNVCLMGFSLGASYVSVHLSSVPSSKGLFHKAILMSGGFADWSTTSLQNAELQYDSFLKVIGCEKERECMEPGPLCDCISRKTTDEIVAGSLGAHTWWAPVVDGITVLKPPMDAVLAGTSLKSIPIIIGGVLDDSDQDLGPNATESDVDRIFSASPPGLGIPPSKLEEAKAIYLRNLTLPPAKGLDNFSLAYWAIRRAFADQSKNCVFRRLARDWQAHAGANAYWYLWKGLPPDPMTYVYVEHKTGPDAPLKLGHCCECPGVRHGTDLKWYLFNTEYLPVGGAYVKLADLMQTYWGGMIYSGDPNMGKGILNEAWLPIQEGGLEFDLWTARLNPNLNSVQCDFWDRMEAGGS